MTHDITIKCTGKKLKALTDSAAHFYLKQLIPTCQISLEIKMRRNMFKNDGAKADCSCSDEEVSPREFEMNIDSSMNIHGILRALAHECVHIKQFVKREMSDVNLGCNFTKWKGKIYNIKKTSYWDLPWEIEAYGREIGLYEEFVRINKHSRASWYLTDADYI